jgi:hypothetical protein
VHEAGWKFLSPSLSLIPFFLYAYIQTVLRHLRQRLRSNYCLWLYPSPNPPVLPNLHLLKNHLQNVHSGLNPRSLTKEYTGQQEHQFQQPLQPHSTQPPFFSAPYQVHLNLAHHGSPNSPDTTIQSNLHQLPSPALPEPTRYRPVSTLSVSNPNVDIFYTPTGQNLDYTR